MQFSQGQDRAHNVLRKQPHQRRNDACKLPVSLGKVVRSVQVVQEKTRSGPIARAGQQVGVGSFKPRVLVGLDGPNPLSQSGISNVRSAMCGNVLQETKNLLSVWAHGLVDPLYGAATR